MSNSSNWPIGRTLSDVSTLTQSGTESDVNEVAALPDPNQQNVKCDIQDIGLGKSYFSAEKQSVYSTVPTDWVNVYWSFGEIKGGFHWQLILVQNGMNNHFLLTKFPYKH